MPKPTFFNLPDDKRSASWTSPSRSFATYGYARPRSHGGGRGGIAKAAFTSTSTTWRPVPLLLHLGAEQKARYLQSTPPPDPALSPFDSLRWMLRGSVGYEATNPRLARIAYRALTGDGPSEAFVAEMRAALRAFYRDLLAKGIEHGHIDPGLDLDAAAFVLTSTLLPLSQYLLSRIDLEPEDLVQPDGPQTAAIEALLDGLLDILEHGMGRHAPKKEEHHG
jgi:hypothetical protein